MTDSQQIGVPLELAYSNIRPRGWYSRFKEWPIQPMSSNLYWNPGQIIRFQMMLNNGVMDPYRSHMCVTVSCPDKAQMPVGGLQIDNSAQSIIHQTVISSNNVEIQRIADYDTLAAYLTDIGFSQIVCQNRQWQGLGYQNYEISNMVNKQPLASQVWYPVQGNGQNIALAYETTGWGNAISPTKMPASWDIYQTKAIAGAKDNADIAKNVSTYVPILNHFSARHISQTNIMNVDVNPDQSELKPNYINLLHTIGHFGNVRSDYNQVSRLKYYIDTPYCYKPDIWGLSPGVIPQDFYNGTGIQPGKAYQPIFNARQNVSMVGANGTVFNKNVPNIPQLFGFSQPYSSKFGVGANQPMISPTIPQCQFAYGATLDYPIPVTQRQFQFPLISCICGVLIPADQFKLIPLKALYNLLIQITLNPYAMFSTGYNDIHEFDSTGMATPIQRNFRLSRFYYNLHLYEWPEETALQWLNQNLIKQIALTGSTWFLSSQYQIPNGQQVRNSWQVNTNSESLGQLVCLFLSNEYLKYPFLRKQFRLSNNVRTMQLKFNTDYFPPQPIVGNGGNPETIDNSGNNQPFVELLLSSNDYKFSTNTPQPRINTFNFAVNGRCFDITNKNTFYDIGMYNNKGTNYNWNSQSVNQNTALGMPNFHENRYVGRAAYTYSFQPYGHSKTAMTGINTMSARPFDVVFDVWNQNYFYADQTLYIFSRANVIVIYSDAGVKVIGR